MDAFDHSAIIFGNQIDRKTIKKANKGKKKYIKKFGDDSSIAYHLSAVPIAALKEMGVKNLVIDKDADRPLELPSNALIVGNIRMGFGHYRISMAIASCAKALGYEPYWFDLASFEATGSKMIRAQNDLYSLASRISQKSRLFNHFFWEPLNSEGFRKITYNAADQRNSELLVPLFHDFPKDVPYVATHVWPSQGAVHAGLTHVVNAIPDNWPMGLHLSEGAIHVVQTPFAYYGYKMLNGMDKKPLKPMKDGDLYEVGHYVDDELVKNVAADSMGRIERAERKRPVRVLATVGGAGAGSKNFANMVRHLLPRIEKGEVTMLINFGDHKDMYEYLCKNVEGYKKAAVTHFEEYEESRKWVDEFAFKDIPGIHCFYHHDIFEAVYMTNLLMRVSDWMVTKPSELVFYPIPKIFMRHIGGHEVYGGIHGREVGDAIWECEDDKTLANMLDTLIEDRSHIVYMSRLIMKRKEEGLYNGGYEAVRLAIKGK
ncbi:MAG: hypothetical protein K6B65_05345 [Bacilli bacterium]|nr:hypothetical protein [Bacilli bacterium]